MPIESILFVGLVIAGLAGFAVVLSYAEWATAYAADETPRRLQIKRYASIHREQSNTVRIPA